MLIVNNKQIKITEGRTNDELFTTNKQRMIRLHEGKYITKAIESRKHKMK